MSWCLETNSDLDLAAALSAHSFDDPTGSLAAALLALGDAHLIVTPQFPNMSAIVANLYFPQLPVGRGLTPGLTIEEVDALRARLAECRAGIDTARPRRGDASLVVDELRFSVDLVDLLARDARARLEADGTIGAVEPDVRRRFATELRAITEHYRALWLARNRPGGLDDSTGWLDNLHAAYETGEPDPTWGGLPAGAST